MSEYPPLRIAGIEPESFVDGPGIRLTVFTQGCHHNCPGCQNPQTHDFEGGHFIEREAIITLAREIKERGLNLVIFTGYTYEQLMKLTPEKPELFELLSFADILIDGPFIMAKKSLDIKFRGSWNQRIIDVQKSLVEGHVVIHQIQLDEMAEHPDREYNT